MNLEDVDDYIYVLFETIDRLKYINPLDQEKEKKRFFASQDYNPQFSYIPLDFSPSQVLKKLEDYKKKLKNGPLDRIFAEKIDRFSTWVFLLKHRGTPDFTKASIDHFGLPSKVLCSKAKKIITLKPEKEKREVPSSEVVSYLQKEAVKRGFMWKVIEKKDIGARIQVNFQNKEVFVKKGELFTKKDLPRLAVHEIGVHVMRFENGLKQKYKIFAAGTAHFESIEEGLAATMEKKKDLLTNKTLRNYAGRVLAVSLSMEKSFREVYEFLSKHFEEDEAYLLTLRAKRGLSDTSQPGAFTKDYTYLCGMEKLKEVKDLQPLFFGRVGLEDLKFAQAIDSS